MSLQLYPYQERHVQELGGVLNRLPYVLDFSMLGTGKTYTAAGLAKERGLKLVVVAPVSVKTKWKEMPSEVVANLEELMSYAELRGVKHRQPKHNLLYRRDFKETVLYAGREIEKDRVEYRSTERLQTLVKEGVLLVVDEIQNIKNESSQTSAIAAMIRTIKETNKKMQEEGSVAPSRILLLSGSPFDKKDQVINFFRTIGVLTVKKICDFNPYTMSYNYEGYHQVISHMNRVAPLTSQQMVMPLGATGCIEKAYQLFQSHFKLHAVRVMTPTVMQAELFKQNGYYHMSDESLALLRMGISGLASSVEFDEQTGRVGRSSGIETLKSITHSLIQIETAKIPTFARLAREHLQKDPLTKVVLCMNYSASIDDLLNHPLLTEYRPLKLTGSVSQLKRTVVLHQFQEASTARRLLVVNTEACSSGIDLDDKTGDFPRTVFVSPSYHMISLYQLCHRFLRQDTKSSTTISMVYAVDAEETRILNALARKGAVMKETTQEQADAGTVFPSDFPNVYEPVMSR